MKLLRNCAVMAVLAAALAAPFGLASAHAAQPPTVPGGFFPPNQNVAIWTVPVWYSVDGQQWSVYGTYFVYVYPNGYTDNSEPLEVAQALNRSGYYSHFDNTQATFWRMGTR